MPGNDQPVRINLPRGHGWVIETFGKEHIAGGYVHLIDADGEIHTRLTAQEFEEKPKQSAVTFLEALGECLENLADDPEHGNYAYEVDDGLYLCGDGDSLWLSTQDPQEWEQEYDEDQELIYYDKAEWAADAEEVIGAFLCCLKEAIEDGVTEE
jgi:hypothetical protein